MFPATSLFDDGIGVGCPDEGLGIVVGFSEVAVNGGLEIDDTAEDATLEPLPGQFGEEALDRIEPGRRGRGEVEMEPRMSLEPGADPGMLVRRVVVDDQMELPHGRGLPVNLVEKTDEFLMPMTGHALSDNLALQHVERSEQGRRAVALIIMGHRPATTALHRQLRLGTVERLNLRLLIDRQRQRVFGRIDVEPDDVLHLGGKLRIVRPLEGAHPMRFQAMRRPDPLHAAMADPSGLAIAGQVQCVASPSSSASVISTTRSITPADSGGLPAGRAGSCNTT